MRNKALLAGLLAGAVIVAACGYSWAEELPSQLCFQQICFTVEIANTPESRNQGLMGRSGLKDGQGMFFEFPASDRHAFWMKNMSFPIDMIWLDASKTVVDVKKAVPPCRKDPCPVYRPVQSAQYVLEISSGAFRKNKLKIGDQAVLK